MESDLEIDVLVARIECVALRDKLRTMSAGSAEHDDTRGRFERAKTALALANKAAHAGKVTGLRPPDPTIDTWRAAFDWRYAATAHPEGCAAT